MTAFGAAGAFWRRHRTLLWTLHSAWALATGIGVLHFARERYDFVLWVVVFLALTWVTTLFFGRKTAAEAGTGIADVGDGTNVTATRKGRAPTLVQEVTSYVTRIMYQETLFFLLPFYAYSTVLRSPNVVFLVLLGGLAVLACLDVLFDRWLRGSAVFGLSFFALVAFAALNLLIPMLLGVAPRQATPVAAGLAVAGAVPLALRRVGSGWGKRLRLAAAAGVFVVLVLGVPSLVPPVPLRMKSATFATGIDRTTLALSDTLDPRVPSRDLRGRLVVLVQVFSPDVVPAGVRLEWKRDGETIRMSREIQITAHERGFRVWDAWRAPSGHVPPGRYRVVLTTWNGRVFGVARVEVAG